MDGVTDLQAFAERIREDEAHRLSPLATPSYPARRTVEEQECDVRTPFQRDRDRLIHSKAFRRMKHKTQVFVLPTGDHYRTRLTHTLEVTQVSRTVARALRLNEDLTEAIGLGHDLGHPPFGHIGEDVLNGCLSSRFGGEFHHNDHSLRIVEEIERDGAGLNLTDQVRDGIKRHSGPDVPDTLEGKIVRVVDRVAYINHDIEDSIRANVLQASDLPLREIEILGQTSSQRIDTLVRDLISESEKQGDIAQSERVGGAMLRLRKFMFDNIYLGERARGERVKIEGVIGGLFDWYCEHPEMVPKSTPESSLAETVTDYIAGMTDRFAVRTWTELSIPRGFSGTE